MGNRSRVIYDVQHLGPLLTILFKLQVIDYTAYWTKDGILYRLDVAKHKGITWI